LIEAKLTLWFSVVEDIGKEFIELIGKIDTKRLRVLF